MEEENEVETSPVFVLGLVVGGAFLGWGGGGDEKDIFLICVHSVWDWFGERRGVTRNLG